MGPRCRGPAGLDAGHHVGHYAGVTRYVPSSYLDFLENVDCTRIINFYIFRLISLPGSEVAHHPTKAGYKPVHMLNAELCVENLS